MRQDLPLLPVRERHADRRSHLSGLRREDINQVDLSLFAKHDASMRSD
jgi:hypothetical protein